MAEECKDGYCTCDQPLLKDEATLIGERLKQLGIHDPAVHRQVLIAKRGIEENTKVNQYLEVNKKS